MDAVDQPKPSPTLPEMDSLRCQLTELNARSRWYSTEIWQIPFAYVGVTGLFIAQVASRGESYLGIAFAVSAGFGVFVVVHVFQIRHREQRAIQFLQSTEKALGLPVTVVSHPGRLKVFQIALVTTVAAYAVAAFFFLR